MHREYHATKRYEGRNPLQDQGDMPRETRGTAGISLLMAGDPYERLVRSPRCFWLELGIRTKRDGVASSRPHSKIPRGIQYRDSLAESVIV